MIAAIAGCAAPRRSVGSFAFTSYALSRDRVVPTAALAPGKRSDDGDFLSLGVVAGITFAPPVFLKSGVVASATYRYLPRVTGTAPDVKRFDASFKYRWWLPSKIAIDGGGTYAHGRELKTYTIEDVLQLLFGVLY